MAEKNLENNGARERGRLFRGADDEVSRGRHLDSGRHARRADRDEERRRQRTEREEGRRAAARRVREEAHLAAIRQQEEEAEWHRRTVLAESRRNDEERRRFEQARLSASCLSRYQGPPGEFQLRS